MKAKGFTFIELIAAMAMMSIIMLAMNYVFSAGVYSYVDGQRKEKAVNTNKLIMTLLSAELKNSNKYVVDPTYVIHDTVGTVIDTTTAAGYVPIVYIEGNAYGNYMYVRKKVGTKKVNNVSKDVWELDKLIFEDQKMKTYRPADVDQTTYPKQVISVVLTDAEKDVYFDASNSENIVAANTIDPNGSNIASEYDTDNAKLAVESLGQNCYLIAQKRTPSASNPYYKIKMEEKVSTLYTVKTAKPVKICDNLQSISLVDEGYECKISIKSIETNHEEEINTSTTILNYRGVS